MKEKLEDINKEIMDDEMPLWIYLPLHPEAKLTDENKKMIYEWTIKSKQEFSIK